MLASFAPKDRAEMVKDGKGRGDLRVSASSVYQFTPKGSGGGVGV